MNRRGQVALSQALLSAMGLQGRHLQACAPSQHRQSRYGLEAVSLCHRLQASRLKATALRLCQHVRAHVACQPWLCMWAFKQQQQQQQQAWRNT